MTNRLPLGSRAKNHCLDNNKNLYAEMFLKQDEDSRVFREFTAK